MLHSKFQTAATDRSRKLRELKELLSIQLSERQSSKATLAFSWTRLFGEIGPGRLVDCLSTRGAGAGLIALTLCKQACSNAGELVVVDPTATFHPPAAVAWGVDAERLLVVTPPTDRESLVAVETALRSPAVSAVWASLSEIEDRAFRRLLLASEAGRAFGVLVRPTRCELQPSLADVQLRFTSVSDVGDPDAPMLVRITQVRNRHGPAGGEAVLAIDWKTGQIVESAFAHDEQPATKNPLRLAAELARATRPA